MSTHGYRAILLALAAPMASASGPPTAADIADARAECRHERQEVAKLEASGTATEAQLQWERSAWDRACAYAERLMVQAGMEKPSRAPVAPAPVPQLVITEHQKPGAEFAAAATSAPTSSATPAAPAPKAAVELKQWHVDELVIREPVRLESPPK